MSNTAITILVVYSAIGAGASVLSVLAILFNEPPPELPVRKLLALTLVPAALVYLFWPIYLVAHTVGTLLIKSGITKPHSGR